MKGGLSTSGRSASPWRQLRQFLNAPSGGGFTVIEVMIVLGVTGALFVSAAILIAGRQSQTAFDQSIRQIQSQIQQVINEVAVGFYPQKGTFQCTAGASSPVLSSGAAGQGTNSGCIFLGKALQFRVAGTDPEEFTVYTIAGLQKNAAGNESTNLNEASPMIVAPSASHSGAGYPDNSITDELQNGLQTARMWYNNGGADIEIGAVAFTNSLAQYSSGTIISGSGQVNVVAIDGTTLGASRATTIEAMNSDAGNKIATGVLSPTGGVFICFASGGTKHYGIVKIGGDSRDLSVTLRIKDNDGSTCTNS